MFPKDPREPISKYCHHQIDSALCAAAGGFWRDPGRPYGPRVLHMLLNGNVFPREPISMRC